MKRAALLALAFMLMMGVAVALMINFTGRQPDRPVSVAQAAQAARSEPASVSPSGLVIPVARARWNDVHDTWGQERGGGTRGHTGTDIMAPDGTPVLAAGAGTVEKLFDSQAGGRTLYVRSPDRRWSFYYAHLAGYAPGIGEGSIVRPGQHIAFVGDTGNAGAGNYHLHFGISRMRADERWYQGEPVNPYPMLAGRAGRR